MRKISIKIYMFLRRAFRGRGLTRISFIRAANFRVEKFLRGKDKKGFVNRHGVIIYLDPRETVSEKFEEYEPKSTEALKKHLKPGDTFADVGASIGWFTLIAAKIVGAKGKVYSFEPEPNSFALLNKNIEANGFRGIVNARNAAAYHKNGKVKLYVPSDAWTWSNLLDPRDDYFKKIEVAFSKDEDRTVHEYEVEALRLDEAIPGKVDFIKIDVEDSTSKVWQGARALLKRNPNMKLLIENPQKEIMDELKDRGYSFVFLDEINGFFFRT